MQELSWSAPEFIHHRKEAGWYWAIAIIAVLLIGFALWQRNFLFAVFIAIATLTVMAWGGRHPNVVTFTLNADGFDIDGKKFSPYAKFKGFAIVQHAHEEMPDEVIFLSKNKISLPISAPLREGEREQIRTLLKQHLPEEEREESLTDHLLRIVRF